MAASRARNALPPLPRLSAALGGWDVALIAEIKRRSPSKGVLNAQMSAAERARDYAAAGARALSVLTEPEEFGGSMEDLTESRQSAGLPIIRKDFHVDPLQVWETKAVGASALLLIARGIGSDRIAEMMTATREAGIEAVVEVRSERELQWALESGATIIGVNCRDLETLEMELEVHDRILPLIPADCIAIAESGIATRRDVERLAALGADAILVGSSLSLAADAFNTVATLTGVSRVRRGS
ncbi:MAG: indole-3-glycerol-phosphate synthase [Gemmatimonadaceae bacterium]